MPGFKWKAVNRRTGKVEAQGIVHNQMTDQAMERFGNRCFDRASIGVNVTDPWKVGLIAATGFTGRSRSDTVASHAGWSTFGSVQNMTFDDDSLWSDDADPWAVSSSNLSPFGLDEGDSIKGYYLRDNSGALLWSTAELASAYTAGAGGAFLTVSYFLNGPPA